MIVDLADPAHSIGVYPGGQSEHPASPHYSDLMEPWAKGDYLALYPVGSASQLPERAGQQAGVRQAVAVLIGAISTAFALSEDRKADQ